MILWAYSVLLWDILSKSLIHMSLKITCLSQSVFSKSCFPVPQSAGILSVICDGNITENQNYTEEAHCCKRQQSRREAQAFLQAEGQEIKWLVLLSEAVMCAFILAFPQRKLLITEYKNIQVTYVGWNLKSWKSTINISTTIHLIQFLLRWTIAQNVSSWYQQTPDLKDIIRKLFLCQEADG